LFEAALTDEQVDEATIRRVVNRLVYGDAVGPVGPALVIALPVDGAPMPVLRQLPSALGEV
jgi:hypothetical protein